MIDNKTIDEGLEFYQIDKHYKDRCYQCAEEINKNNEYQKAFDKIYKIVYDCNSSEIRKFWSIKSIEELFANNINLFVTNLMIVLGYKFHKNNINQYQLDEEQIRIHKQRVKECFENDLNNRGYKGIRISQMLWAIYLMRVKIIEVGRLQYEYFSTNENNESIIKIHIPRGEKLDVF